MRLSERLIEYRAKHGLTQKQLADLMNEPAGLVFRAEGEKTKLHKVNYIRLEMKIKELEEKEGE